MTADDVIVMFHDAVLGRTTNGKGKIAAQNYHGQLENVRTVHQPVQKIPTFNELCDLLMKPEYHHVKANVRRVNEPDCFLATGARLTFLNFLWGQIDIKPDNDPDRLFRLMKGVVSQYDGFETILAPRIILGLWHPKFITPAIEHVPSLRRIHIGGSPALAKQYFWDACDGFSMYFASLMPAEGQDFIREVHAAGKDVMVWTVNRADEMVEATRWGVAAVLTDRTDEFKQLRREMSADFVATYHKYVGSTFRWATWRYYTLPLHVIFSLWRVNLEHRAGESFAESHRRRMATRASPALVASEGTTAVGTPMIKAADADVADAAAVPAVPTSAPLLGA